MLLSLKFIAVKSIIAYLREVWHNSVARECAFSLERFGHIADNLGDAGMRQEPVHIHICFVADAGYFRFGKSACFGAFLYEHIYREIANRLRQFAMTPYK